MHNEIEVLMKTIEELNNVKSVESQSKLVAELENKNTLVIAYQNDIEQKKFELERMDKKIISLQIQMTSLESELEKIKHIASEPRFYPAAEIRSKKKFMVNIRFIRSKIGEYRLEISDLKEKKIYSLEMIEIHLDKTDDDVFTIKWKNKSKNEIFISEYVHLIHENYIKSAMANSSLKK